MTRSGGPDGTSSGGPGSSRVAIVFPSRRRAELVRVPGDDAPLADDEVTGTTLASVLSPGTELGMQFDAADGFPHRPGYGAVFRIDAVGAGVDDLGPGDAVFCIGAHASTQRKRRADVIPVPPDLDPAAAVCARLAAIPWARLELAAARPPAAVLVTGLGPVGHLAARLAAARGHPVCAVDPDPARRDLLEAVDGVELRDAVPEDGPARAHPFALALECSGRAEALVASCRAVADRAEIVLIGVPWRDGDPGSLRAVWWKAFWHHLVVRGGWEFELPWLADDGHPLGHRDCCAAALTWIADGRLALDGLLHTVDPGDAQAVYDRALRGEGPALFTVFDWSRPAG